jgi:hypothetical protein
VGERGSEGRKEGREGRLDWTGLDWTGLAWTIPPVRGRGRESMCAKHSLITLISSFPPSPSFIEIIQLAQDKPNFKRFPSSTSPITYLRRRIGARGSYCNSCSKTRQTLQWLQKKKKKKKKKEEEKEEVTHNSAVSTVYTASSHCSEKHTLQKKKKKGNRYICLTSWHTTTVAKHLQLVYHLHCLQLVYLPQT